MTARVHPSVSYSFTMRLRIEHRAGMLARVMASIARQKGDPGAVDVVTSNPTFKVREGPTMHGELLAKGSRGEENPTSVLKTRKTVL